MLRVKENERPPYIGTAVQLVEKLCFCLRSRLFKINFSDDMCVGKITSIRTTVRIGGIAANECGQGGCFGGKVPTGLFRRSRPPYIGTAV